MKKILYIIADLLIAALLAGAYVIQYFAKRKLGMNRWIVFKISKVKEALPVDMTVLLAVFYLIFTLYFSQEIIRSYYLALPLIGLANVVQLLKTFVAMKWCRGGQS